MTMIKVIVIWGAALCGTAATADTRNTTPKAGWLGLLRCASQLFDFDMTLTSSQTGQVGSELVVLAEEDSLLVYTPDYAGALRRQSVCGDSKSAQRCYIRLPYSPIGLANHGYLYLQWDEANKIAEQRFLAGRSLGPSEVFVATSPPYKLGSGAAAAVPSANTHDARVFNTIPDEVYLWPKGGAARVNAVAREKMLSRISAIVSASSTHVNSNLPDPSLLRALKSCERAGALNDANELTANAGRHARTLQATIARRHALAAKQHLVGKVQAATVPVCGQFVLTTKVTNKGSIPFFYTEKGCGRESLWRSAVPGITATESGPCFASSSTEKTLSPGAMVETQILLNVKRGTPTGLTKFKVIWDQRPDIESKPITISITGDKCSG